MHVVGLTGAIASGKSLAANHLTKLGVDVIDADAISKQLTQDNTEYTQAILAHFGDRVVSQGKLNRNALADIVFSNADERLWLEQLLHPAIRKKMAELIQNAHGPYCVCVIPLLAEHWPHPLIDEVLLIETSLEEQHQRLSTRNQLSETQITQRIQAQTTPEARRQIANHVIENHHDMDSFLQAITQWHHAKIKQLSHKDSP